MNRGETTADEGTRHAPAVSPTLRREAERLLNTVVDGGFCVGCGACAAASGGALKIEMDAYRMYRPRLTDATEEPAFASVESICPFSGSAQTETEIADEIFPDTPHHHSALGRWRQAHVGWVEQGDLRTQGSSGGFVTWILEAYFERGLIDGVAHVGPHQPTEGDSVLFKYNISRSVEEIRRRAKSRYYPIELSAVLREIRNVPGRYAVVGIPCYIKAVRLLMRSDPVLRERIKLCVGLFCGHLKSAAMVDSFALQAGVKPAAVRAVNFRLKQPERRADIYTVGMQTRDQRTIARDWWHMVDGDWGMGFFQYSACNFCDDVTAEVADVSCGDAWVQPYTSDGRGTNVVVVRTLEAERIIEEGMRSGALAFTPVSGDFVAGTQAAGLRQRREGLAYRMWRFRHRWLPRKRVAADASVASWWRRRIYDFRLITSAGSHVVFRVARQAYCFPLYLVWGWSFRKLYRVLYKFAGPASKTPPTIPLINPPPLTGRAPARVPQTGS